MSLVRRAVGALAEEIAVLSEHVGRKVAIDQASVADRSAFLALKPPGLWSANRSCRLVCAADGWIAVNLARESDHELVPAWIGARPEADPWRAITAAARTAPRGELVSMARLLGLPVAGVGEITAVGADAPLHRRAAGSTASRGEPLTVIDLTSIWAGPLCGAVLAEAGFSVSKIESLRRPDALREASPVFFERLNGRKRLEALDLADPSQVAALGDRIAAADLVLTSARPRAFTQLGLSPEALFARNPGLTWVAISGYGWVGEGADRVAFGDDAAAAGGLLRWTERGEPRFLGDALADPLTGLSAAAGALKAVARGGGFLVDAGLAPTAAGVAAQGLRSAA
ncbi:MAG: CoA transferase [Caulobacteraceae bacterium]|nr:CoA transferase [Caulobacteraceae bacterium]